MLYLLLRLGINAVAIWVASLIVPGVFLDTAQIGPVLLVALVFGVVNTLLRPFLMLLGLPFLLVTFGLFAVVINGVLLEITDALTAALTVEGLGPAILGSLVVSAVSWMLGMLLEDGSAEPAASE
jgi:putative membrane protein